MTETTEKQPKIAIPKRQDLMVLRRELAGVADSTVTELQGDIAPKLSDELLYAIAGGLHYAIEVLQRLPPEEALLTLKRAAACCADRVVRRVFPRSIIISGLRQEIDPDHEENGFSVNAVWFPPSEFESSLACDPDDENVQLLREHFGCRKLLLIKTNAGRLPPMGWLSLETGKFDLLPTGARITHEMADAARSQCYCPNCVERGRSYHH